MLQVIMGHQNGTHDNLSLGHSTVTRALHTRELQHGAGFAGWLHAGSVSDMALEGFTLARIGVRKSHATTFQWRGITTKLQFSIPA